MGKNWAFWAVIAASRWCGKYFYILPMPLVAVTAGTWLAVWLARDQLGRRYPDVALAGVLEEYDYVYNNRPTDAGLMAAALRVENELFVKLGARHRPYQVDCLSARQARPQPAGLLELGSQLREQLEASDANLPVSRDQVGIAGFAHEAQYLRARFVEVARKGADHTQGSFRIAGLSRFREHGHRVTDVAQLQRAEFDSKLQLAAELREDGLIGDAGLPSDLLHRDLAVTALHEQPAGGFHDPAPGQLCLLLAQRRPIWPGALDGCAQRA